MEDREWGRTAVARDHIGLTQAEVAAKLGVSRVRIAQLEDRALRKLARHPIIRALGVEYGLLDGMEKA